MQIQISLLVVKIKNSKVLSKFINSYGFSRCFYGHTYWNTSVYIMQIEMGFHGNISLLLNIKNIGLYIVKVQMYYKNKVWRAVPGRLGGVICKPEDVA